jgi:plasmid stability protein
VALERDKAYAATRMVVIRLEEIVPTTLTLKNIPDEVYERLKAAASSHRRSLNSEAIVCLEASLVPTRRISAEERIRRIRALRAGLEGVDFSDEDIDAFRREGRP